MKVGRPVRNLKFMSVMHVAVSYTHLDVYKRQGINGRALSGKSKSYKAYMAKRSKKFSLSKSNQFNPIVVHG